MIVSCGEALIDMLPRKTAEGGACFQPFAGGAVFNTAIALARLGAPSALFTGLSTDLFGGVLRRTMEASGVDAGYAAVSDRPTTLAFVELVDAMPAMLSMTRTPPAACWRKPTCPPCPTTSTRCSSAASRSR